LEPLLNGPSSDASALHDHPFYAILRETLGTNRYLFNLFNINDRTASVGFTESLTGGSITETLMSSDFATAATAANLANLKTTQLDDFAPTVAWAKSAAFEVQASFTQITAQVAMLGLGDGMSLGTATTTAKHYAIFVENGTLYCSNANGTTQTRTDISSGVTLTEINTFQIEVISGTSIKCIVNGTVKATHTTNLPGADSSGYNINFWIYTTANADKTMRVYRQPFLLIKAT